MCGEYCVCCMGCKSEPAARATNNVPFLKGHMSDQVSILIIQNRNVVGRFFKLLFLSGTLFEIIISYIIYLLFGKKFVWT